MHIPKLERPREFQRRHADLFPSISSLRYHLDKRHENGMLEAGVVLETALGLRIDPERFPAWLLGKTTFPERSAA